MHISKIFIEKKFLKTHFLLVCEVGTNNFRTNTLYTSIVVLSSWPLLIHMRKIIIFISVILKFSVYDGDLFKIIIA